MVGYYLIQFNSAGGLGGHSETPTWLGLDFFEKSLEYRP